MRKSKRVGMASMPILSLLFLTGALLNTGAHAVDLQKASESIVKLYVTSQAWDIRQPWSKNGIKKRVCTGFFIEGGILTNAHCVTDSTFIEVELLGRPDRYEARRIAVSHDVDLALLTLKQNDLPELPAPIAFGSLPELRDHVVTIGYPMGGRQISFTEGVISRIEIMTYAHSRLSNLMVQTDAAINPGNSGGPVFSDASVACLGVATQVSRGGQGIGYFIPTPVVRQFLKDLEDGRIDGMPGLGAKSQPLENPALRADLKMSDGQSGVRIVKIAKGSTLDGVFQVDDVILSIDGHTIFNDGRVRFRDVGKIGLSFYITTHQVGDEVTFTLLRDGQVVDQRVRLGHYSYSVVPTEPEYEKKPRFIERGGLVFRRLEPRYFNKSNMGRLRAYTILTQGDIEGLEDIVVIGAIYPASLTKGYDSRFIDRRVLEINGRRIGRLEDVADALRSPSPDGFDRIEIDGGERLVLDVAGIAKEEPEIRKRYGITEPAYLGD